MLTQNVHAEPKKRNNERKVQKFEELIGIEDVIMNIFKYFRDCNKEVEEILLEDISKDMQILHETESFNSSQQFMQEKLSENNKNKALALIFWPMRRESLIKFSGKKSFTLKNIIENGK